MVPDKQFNDIRAAIPQLSKEQFLQLESDIKAVRSLQGPSPVEILASVMGKKDGRQVGYSWAVEAICQKLESMGLLSVKVDLVVASILKGKDYVAFCGKMTQLDAWFEKHQIIKRGDKQWSIGVAVGMMATNMTNYEHYPATPVRVMRRIEQVPAYLDKACPGYAQSGVLHWMLKGRDLG